MKTITIYLLIMICPPFFNEAQSPHEIRIHLVSVWFLANFAEKKNEPLFATVVGWFVFTSSSTYVERMLGCRNKAFHRDMCHLQA